MSLIFDTFASRRKAEAFLAAVKKSFGIDGKLFMDVEEAQEADPIPAVLNPPIVHIDRSKHDDAIQVMVFDYDGTFVGT